MLLESLKSAAEQGKQDATIPALFASLLKRLSDAEQRVAIEDERASLTYQTLDQQSNQVAHWLAAKALPNEAVVGVCGHASLEFIVVILGIMKAGYTYLPLDPYYPQQRLAYILADSQPALVLCQQPFVDVIKQHQVTMIAFDQQQSAWQHESITPLVKAISPLQLAYIIYTSGSSGQPKGTLLNHLGLVNLISAQAKAFYLEAQDRVLQFASINFDASISEIFVAIGNGATLCLANKKALEVGQPLQATLQNRQINLVTLAPVVLPFLDSEQLPNLKTLVVAGEACPAHLAKVWGKSRRFINAYGPTEATVCASSYLCIADSDEAPPIGKAIDNTTLYVLDDNLEPVATGEAGELYIGGISLARGYLNKSSLTAERFVPDPFLIGASGRMYKTGDLVKQNDNGDICFLGRLDDQVKIRGFRIELGDIENQLRLLDGVSDALVMAHSDNEQGSDKYLLAYLTAAQADINNLPSVDSLRATLATRLPDYMIPAQFVRLSCFPLTPNGKVDRKALPKPNSLTREQAFVAPVDELEHQLCLLVGQVLNRSEIGTTDDFFAIGGHSLAAARLVIKLNSTFNLSLSIAALYQAPTVLALKQLISQDNQQPADDSWLSVSTNLTKRRIGQNSATRLVMFAGAGGSADVFTGIAEQLGDVELYLVRHDGVENDRPAQDSLMAMAKQYAEQLAELPDADRTVLAGYCIGGLLAYEAANLLSAHTPSDIRLVFIDTALPKQALQIQPFDCEKFKNNFFEAIALRHMTKPDEPWPFADMDVEQCITWLRQTIAWGSEQEVESWDLMVRRWYNSEISHTKASIDYWVRESNAQHAIKTDMPFQSLALQSDEFAATEANQLEDWSELHPKRVTTQLVGGQHLQVLQQSQLDIAKAISEFVKQVKY